MSIYILRRILYTIPIWLGVYLITFSLFHIRDPLVIARVQMPQAPETVLRSWIRANNYHLPRFVNFPSDATQPQADGEVHKEFAEHSIFYSRFFLGLKDLALLELGNDRDKRPIIDSMLEKAGPSFSIMAPAFFLTLFFSISLSLLSAALRNSSFDRTILFASVIFMSLPVPVYLLLCDSLFGRYMLLFPVYNNPALPILIAFFSSIGGQIRFYRTVFLEQMEQDYIRTARAKGAGELRVLFVHVLRNSMIPILTSVVMSLPFLITGSLLLEEFYGIPGMGNMMYSAIFAQDFKVIQAMVYLGSFLYMFGSLLTDISYILADPRIVLS